MGDGRPCTPSLLCVAAPLCGLAKADELKILGAPSTDSYALREEESNHKMMTELLAESGPRRKFLVVVFNRNLLYAGRATYYSLRQKVQPRKRCRAAKSKNRNTPCIRCAGERSTGCTSNDRMMSGVPMRNTARRDSTCTSNGAKIPTISSASKLLIVAKNPFQTFTFCGYASSGREPRARSGTHPGWEPAR